MHTQRPFQTYYSDTLQPCHSIRPLRLNGFMTHRLFFLVSLFFLISCHSQEQQTDPLETVVFEQATISSLREYFKAIEVVRLDHQGEIVVGIIAKILQRDSTFYIGDRMGSKQIYRFGKDGRYLSTIGKIGRGPEEYEFLNDFYPCNDRDEIYIQSAPDISLYCYDKSGQYKSKKQIRGQALSFTLMDDRCWVYCGHNNGYQPEQLMLTDTNLQVLHKYLPLETKIFPMAMEQAFFQEQEHTYLLLPFNETVYEVTYDTLMPVMRFDFGEWNVPASFWSGKSIEALDNLSKKGFIYINSIMENKDYILVDIHGQRGGAGAAIEGTYYCGIKNKKTGHWDWVKQNYEGEGTNCDWLAMKSKCFTQDGRLMIFVFGHELDQLTEADRQLLSNPEALNDVDPEMDMFIMLCTLK